MPNLAVIGAQWGDEGKGKVVDLLSDRFDVVARFQGGPNAGHTVTIEGHKHALHHVPSGVFRPSARIVIGNGTVLNLERLLEELEALEEAGISVEGRLFISDRAHVILPIMTRLDSLAEAAATDATKIGTTQRGIGPTYESKASRSGIRMADLADRDHLRVLVGRLVDGAVGDRLRSAGESPGDPEALADEAYGHGQRLGPYIADTALLLNEWLDEGASILFEGAQGTLLDLDHGSYPFVTSSSTVAGSLCGGLGLSPTRVDAVLGVLKAYCTRVGGGPMPTELDDGPEGLGQKLRDRGNEYGTTTGRPRRCGWFDGVAAAYSNRLSRFDTVCITLLDVLDAFEEIRVCTGYRLDGRQYRSIPASAAVAQRVEPVYESLPGWMTDTTAIRHWEDLPHNARSYLDRLGELIGAEVGMVGVGPDRSQSIVRPGSWLTNNVDLH
jgi:adenylosuccinate synthase